jgi:hypothetical protein
MACKIQFPGGINLNAVGKEGTVKESSQNVTWRQLSTQFVSFPLQLGPQQDLFTITRLPDALGSLSHVGYNMLRYILREVSALRLIQSCGTCLEKCTVGRGYDKVRLGGARVILE